MNETQKKGFVHSVKHYHEIDIVKGIGILCIVAGHIFPMSLFNQFLFSFHVPLFFLISGFTYRYYENKRAFYRKKFRRLIVPYLFFSLASILLMWIIDKFIPLNTDTRILPNIAGMLFANSNSGYMTWNNPLWFLPCMYVSLVVMDFCETVLRRKKRENSIVLRILLMLAFWGAGILLNNFFSVFLPLHIETALFLSGFSELGYILSRYRILDKEANGTKKSGYSMLIVWGSIGSVLGIVASCCNGWTDVRTHLFGQIPLLLIVSSMGFSAMVLVISMLITKCRWLEYIGLHSISILVMHKFPVMFIKILLPGIQETLNNSGSILGFAAGLMITALAIVVCLICEQILLLLFPFALGVKNEKIKVVKKQESVIRRSKVDEET